jgi:hypothetical protein
VILVVHLVASPAVNELKTVEKQQDNYKFTKDFGAQKRLMVPVVGVKICQSFNYS